MSPSATYQPDAGLEALAGQRAGITVSISEARRLGTPTLLAYLTGALVTVRRALAEYRGTPPHLIHRDGWDLSTEEARVYFDDLDARANLCKGQQGPLVAMTDAEHRDYREGYHCGAEDYRADRPYNPVPDADHLMWSQGYCDGWTAAAESA